MRGGGGGGGGVTSSYVSNKTTITCETQHLLHISITHQRYVQVYPHNYNKLMEMLEGEKVVVSIVICDLTKIHHVAGCVTD